MEKIDPMICEHLYFDAHVKVGRLVNEKDGSIQFVAEVTIECDSCGVPMAFKGLIPGLNLNGVAVSPDLLEARLAIEPNTTVKPFQLLRGIF